MYVLDLKGALGCGRPTFQLENFKDVYLNTYVVRVWELELYS
jgi:hypothetical protein